MKVLENVDLKDYSSLKIGGVARYLCEIENEDDILEFLNFASTEKMPRVIIGSGTNTFYADGLIKKVFGLIKIKGKFKSYESPEFVNIEVGAGENWDDFVAWTVENNFEGTECMSLIPGTLGAAPIQNIGAYGQEIKNVITHVRAYDSEYDEFVEIPVDQCLLDYRDSIFKKNPGRFIISSISVQLKKVTENLPTPQYRDLQLHFLALKRKTASLSEIRNAVIKIRKEKLPDPATEPNCGSFFKNPIVPSEFAAKLLAEFPKMPQFKVDSGTRTSKVKLSAGWLIDSVGLKGFEYKNLAIDSKSPLVIINKGESKAHDLLELEKIINEKIEQSFDITLEREPNFIK